MKKFKRYPSTILALICLILSAFMAQPTLASLVVHVLLFGLLFLTTGVAHWEGRVMGRSEKEAS